MSADAVVLSAVTKRFGDVVAVDDLDLAIGDGEFFAMLGPSGCGKTTTLRMIAGLDYPTSGSLRIHGEEMGTRPPNERPVNTVFQNYALFPHLSVLDNVAFGLRMQGVGRKEREGRGRELLELVQLPGLADRRPDQLSGGQQQRVALARALVNRPRVLLLDEPLAALDLKLRRGMQQELKALQRELGVSFVFVTHDQEEALTMSDRVAVLDQGRLLQVGTPEELYERPADRFVADFIGTTNLLDGRVVESAIELAPGSRVPLVDGGGAAADRRTLSVRPEIVRLEPRGTRSVPWALEGLVETVTYLGRAREYGVRAAGLDLLVRRAADETPRFEVGDPVEVSWDPASAWTIPA